VLANDDVQGPGAADFLVKTVNAKKIAVIDDQSEYGKGLADAVRKQVKTDGATDVKDTRSTQGLGLLQHGHQRQGRQPGRVFFGGYYAAAAKLVNSCVMAGSRRHSCPATVRWTRRSPTWWPGRQWRAAHLHLCFVGRLCRSGRAGLREGITGEVEHRAGDLLRGVYWLSIPPTISDVRPHPPSI